MTTPIDPVAIAQELLKLDGFATKDWVILRAPEGYPSDYMFILDESGKGKKVATLQGDYNNALFVEYTRANAPAIARRMLLLEKVVEACKTQLSHEDDCCCEVCFNIEETLAELEQKP